MCIRDSINAAAREVMSTIAREIGMLPNRVVIEGHTDAQANRTRRGSSTNWEISTRRANAARRFLIDNGMRRDQVAEIRGYASQRLRLWHEPQSPRNRRITILVLLERGVKKMGVDDQGKQHPLLKTLQNLDYREKGPTNQVELTPAGETLPSVPPDGGVRPTGLPEP